VETRSSDEHQVTPLELFFDLVFVFAITQVTSLLVHNPTWGGVLHGILVLAAICSLVVAWEAIRYRESRVQVRHPELAD
jgi:low temperature requirement protein LtrA